MTPRNPADDEELVTRTLAGQVEAFSRLVERYQRPVLSLIYRMVHDPALAEDLAQEAFVRAYERLDSYQPGRKFSSWLFKVAHNRTIDFLRRKKPLEVDLEASGDDGQSSWEVLAADEDTSSPARRLEMGETARAVSAALAGLRENYRAILVLRFEHALSYQEIAEVLDLTMASVKVQLHRARKALARELEKRGFEAPEAFT